MKIEYVQNEIVSSGGWMGYPALTVFFSKTGKNISLPRFIDLLIKRLPTYRRLFLTGDVFSQPKNELFTLFNNLRNWGLVRGLYNVMINDKIENVMWDTVYREVHSILCFNLECPLNYPINTVELTSNDYIEITERDTITSKTSLLGFLKKISKTKSFRPTIIIHCNFEYANQFIKKVKKYKTILKELDIRINSYE